MNPLFNTYKKIGEYVNLVCPLPPSVHTLALALCYGFALLISVCSSSLLPAAIGSGYRREVTLPDSASEWSHAEVSHIFTSSQTSGNIPLF